MRMRTQTVAGVLASAALSIGLLASPAGAAGAPAGNAGSETAGAAAASSPSATERPMSNTGIFTADGVRIHANSGNGPVLGLGYSGQSVTVHCNAEYAPGVFTFVYGTNNATGVTGYIYARHLSVSGDGPC